MDPAEPLAELHVHLDGSLRASTFVELHKALVAQGSGDLGAPDHQAPTATFATEEDVTAALAFQVGWDLPRCLESFATTLTVLQTAGALERVAFEICQDLHTHSSVVRLNSLNTPTPTHVPPPPPPPPPPMHLLTVHHHSHSHSHSHSLTRTRPRALDCASPKRGSTRARARARARVHAQSHAEIRHCPSLHRQGGLGDDAIVTAVEQGLRRATEACPSCRFYQIITVLRDLGPSEAMVMAKLACKHAGSKLVVGIDLAGNEITHPARAFLRRVRLRPWQWHGHHHPRRGRQANESGAVAR